MLVLVPYLPQWWPYGKNGQYIGGKVLLPFQLKSFHISDIALTLRSSRWPHISTNIAQNNKKLKEISNKLNTNCGKGVSELCSADWYNLTSALASVATHVLVFHDLELLRYVRIIEIYLHKANVRVFLDLELLRYVRCAIERQL